MTSTGAAVAFRVGPPISITRYNNCAPRDQQSQDYLVGGERVDVLNMSEDGALSFEIPKVRLSFRTRFGI